MKTKIPWILCVLLAVALVVMALDRKSQVPETLAAAGDEHAAHETKAERKILYWVDPMHPAYKSDKPGTAPDCGMDLVPVYEGEDGVASAVEGYSTVKMSTERQQLIGVKTGKAETRSIGRTLRAVGRVAVDETRLHTVTTKFDGYIEQLYVNYTGQEVRTLQPASRLDKP